MFLIAFLAKYHLPRCDALCYGNSYRLKLQWLQDPSEINGENLNNVDVKPADISGIKRGNI
jgi:hypothetical protein